MEAVIPRRELFLTKGEHLRHVIRRRLYFRGLPGFVIVGAQKAGTRFLQEHLEGHPNIRFGKPLGKKRGCWKLRNEIHYFDRHHDRGLEWYRSHFLKAPLEVLRNEGILFGEKTPCYLCEPKTPERMHRALPDVKLLVLLRNPVSRAYSQYRMTVRKAQEDRPFDEVVRRERDRAGRESSEDQDPAGGGIDSWGNCIARGIYAPQIERWFRYFPRESFKIIQSEKMFECPQRIHRKVLAFLELPAWEPEVFVNWKERGHPPMPARIGRTLREFYRPYNQALYQLLGEDYHWD